MVKKVFGIVETSGNLTFFGELEGKRARNVRVERAHMYGVVPAGGRHSA